MNKRYFSNCFILFLPILLWNILLTSRLPRNYQPDLFSKGIPPCLIYVENISRLTIFLFAFITSFSVSNLRQKIGFYIYVVGVLLYVCSWAILIWFPESIWSKGIVGFSAPALTPAIWLTGICLMGNSFYFNLPFKRWPFILVSAIFLFCHIHHTIMVYSNVN